LADPEPTPASTPAGHPPWAEELRRRYLRGEASQFVLHGNVFDLVAYGDELLPVREYLTDRLLSESKDVVVSYNVSTGGKIVRRKPAAELAGFEELLVARERGKFLPAMERVLRTTQRVAAILEYAETIAPAADPALMSDDDRSAVVTLHRWSMSARDRGVRQRGGAAGREPLRAAPQAGRQPQDRHRAGTPMPDEPSASL
jgi:hypothetical protein